MTRAIDLRLGIDVGGTHTDAVLLDRADGLLAKTKRPTTQDVSSGIADAIDAVLSAPGIHLRGLEERSVWLWPQLGPRLLAGCHLPADPSCSTPIRALSGRGAGGPGPREIS